MIWSVLNYKCTSVYLSSLVCQRCFSQFSSHFFPTHFAYRRASDAAPDWSIESCGVQPISGDTHNDDAAILTDFADAITVDGGGGCGGGGCGWWQLMWKSNDSRPNWIARPPLRALFTCVYTHVACMCLKRHLDIHKKSESNENNTLAHLAHVGDGQLKPQQHLNATCRECKNRDFFLNRCSWFRYNLL